MPNTLSADRSERRMVIVVMLAGSTLSLVMNNIASAAVLLPAVTAAGRRAGVSPARLLMPLAFSTLLGTWRPSSPPPTSCRAACSRTGASTASAYSTSPPSGCRSSPSASSTRPRRPEVAPHPRPPPV